MKRQDTFSTCHPLVELLYFTLVLLFTMCLPHPGALGLSLVCAGIYALRLRGARALGRDLRYLLPMALLAAVVNPAFSHRGITILTYLPSGNPLTLESILYGLFAAGLLCAVILWFFCLTEVLTSDKFVYLFGRVIPALSLVLSMSLRLAPRFKAQFQLVADAQRGLGRDVSQGPILQRLRTALSILSILVTWSLENAIETSDSMKSRGYGLPGRTAFSIYRLDARDKALLLWLGLCGMYLTWGWAAGALSWRWYPSVKAAPLTPFTASFFLIFLALCLTPVILDRREEAAWTLLNCES